MSEAARPRQKVLLVDDNPDVVDSVSRYLRKRGLEVITSDTPLGVRAMITQHTPSVIVLDVMMPALDGVRLARMMRDSATTDAAVIFFSAMAEEDLHRMTSGLRGTTYVAKTDGAEALYAAIRAAGAATKP